MKHKPSWKGDSSSISQRNFPHFTRPEGSLTLYLALHNLLPRQFHLLPGIGVIQCFAALALTASYSPVMTVQMIAKSFLWINDSLTFNVTLFFSQPNAVGR